ncbi:substrate-binding domain-containing protein [Helicobacter kayseriensis]|uniref:substrate-binding domain-containing protein n=1 Tax=Helicobacter kayseriensis TaxID=2905877 RepID=UPI001E424660|nr:substrate-binding domain-containing protein [Helicobacter kayseriensis]MCE3046564.1 substrate-binding domain-containing protein [Helicobacter kayseriensis]MCE3048134.1 substrate-binding domain-containing protein [Helicobacter kayseriensis]
MKKSLAILGLSALLINASELKIAGSSTVYPFSAFVAEEYSAIKNTRTPIVESVGTGGGFKIFCEGKTDIANASRTIKESEFQNCLKNGVTDIMGIMIGYDGIVLAQNKINAPINLTLEQLFLALAKEIPQDGKLIANPYTHWNQIHPSLPNRKITIYGPPSSSGTRDTIEELILGEVSKTFKEYGSQAGKYKSIRQDSAYIPSGENDNLIVTKLSADKEALGLFGYGFLANNQDKIDALSIDSIQANEENIANGTYELARSLFIYINLKNKESLEFARIFMNNDLASSDGELSKIGLVPLNQELLQEVQKRLQNPSILTLDLVKEGKVSK